MRSQKAHHGKKRACHLGGSLDPIGYCRLHKNTVSKNQMKNRDCLGKECGAFKRYEDHPYWEYLKRQEEKKHGEER